MTLVEKQPTVERSAPVPSLGRARARIVGGGVLILIGTLWLLERSGAIDVGVTAVLALATLAVGLSLMLLADDGPHGGLIVFGTILGLIALLTAAAPFEGLQGGVGDRVVQIDSVDAIANDYNLAMGKLTIDLRDVDDLTAVTELTASVGLGELIVRVPLGTEVQIDARVGTGELQLFGQTFNGVGLDETYDSPGFAGSDRGLVLELQALTGRVEVTR